MDIKQFSNVYTFQVLASLLLIGYLCLGFIPNLEAVDKIAPQWVAMNLLNLFSISIFFYFRETLKQTIFQIVSSSISLLYLGFIIWAALSYFYAINSTEVIVNITRQFNVLIMFFSMGILLFNLKNKELFISWVISIILSVEIYAVLSEALEMINTKGLIDSGILKGVTANRNITAFSLAIKIPFLLYLSEKVKKLSKKVLLNFLIYLSVLCLTIIQSRASFLAVGLIVVGFIALKTVSFFRQTKNIKTLFSLRNILVPLLLALITNKILIADIGADAISRAATISFSTNDGSVDKRLRYYEDVITHLKSNPIFGTGLGNWKLKSIDYDSKDIYGYVVPYHAHSDFIQLGAELGILGFFLYLSVFLWAVYYVYVFIKHTKRSLEEKTFVFMLLMALGVYFIDANLNFPIARPQVIVVWSVVMALIVIYNQKNKVNNKSPNTKLKLTPLFLSLAFIFLLPSLYITSKVYESLKGQMFLLQDFNSGSYNVTLDKIDNIVPDIPNITVTTLPMSSVKARYYLNAKQYDKALALIEKGIKENPYIYYSESLKSIIFQEKGQLDSALVYAKKAFFGLPNNDFHAGRFINLINLTRNKEALEESFELFTFKNKEMNWENYLIVALGLYPSKNPTIIERAKKATELFPSNPKIHVLYQQISIGSEMLNLANEFSAKGLEFFNKKDYYSAAQQFEKAIEANPLDNAHFENAATCNYMIGNLEKAEQQIDVVINDLNPLNGKCEYIKALIFIKMGDPIGACPLFAKSRDSGFSPSGDSFKKYCE